MKRYYGISLVISGLALFLWVTSVAIYAPPRAADGNGPDATGLLIFFSIWPLGLLLLHSTVLASFLRRRRPLSILGGRHGLAIHTVLIGIFAACLLAWAG